MAFTKKQKSEMLSQYSEWLKKSNAVFMVEYNNMTVKDVETLRAKVREAGGSAHVVKNTLFTKAFKEANIEYSEALVKTTMVGFAVEDAPAVAKVFAEAAKESSEKYALKGGILDGVEISIDQIKALSDLPPLPVMRATLLGVLSAPASKLVRTLAEPARQIAAVVKARSEQGEAGTPVAA